jgi:hypothetical protein
MYKPAFLILLLLLMAASVSAQEEEVLTDTVVTMLKPAGAKRTGTITFDRIGEQKPVAIRAVPQRVVDSLKAADEFWYADAALPKKMQKINQEGGPSILHKRWFRNLLWVIILCSFIGVVLWYLISGNIFVFRKAAKSIGSETEASENTEDLFSFHYDKEIAAAVAAGNYRLAVRLWYLQTLKLLTESGLIDYRFGRTNQHYVNQLSRHSLYKDFSRLTRNFEYTWYGQFQLSAEAYERMREDFVQFQNGLRV